MTELQLIMGLDAITSYRRLAYTPWYAIAELVDNATQSFFDNRVDLDRTYQVEKSEGLLVAVTYDGKKEGGFLRVSDNAMGMSLVELERAMHVGLRPTNPSGRSRYGMGLKTAACWIGNMWTVRTKKLGETIEHQVTVDVQKVAAGNGILPYQSRSNQPSEAHYTIIEITDHNRSFQGRTLGKIRDFLRSMYRQDFRNRDLVLMWQGERQEWQEQQMLEAKDGTRYRKEFKFEVDDKPVYGWVGILKNGSRASAGFSIICSDRIIKGWPDSWRPTTLYGQLQGTNDLVNQRLIGEIHLDDFEVSHTKDDILWLGSQEEDVEAGLREHCGDYREEALKYRRSRDDERGPSNTEVDVAIDEMIRELQSPEMVDKIDINFVPSEDVVIRAKEKIVSDVTNKSQETFRVKVDTLTVKVFLASDLSVNDPYVVPEATADSEVIVIVNTEHPHWGQLKASEGVANYMRHCIYDAIAEWQARRRVARIDPDTIKLLKDRLLRVSFEIEEHETAPVS